MPISIRKIMEISRFSPNNLLLWFYFKLLFINKILLYNESHIYNRSIDCLYNTQEVYNNLYIWGKTTIY